MTTVLLLLVLAAPADGCDAATATAKQALATKQPAKREELFAQAAAACPTNAAIVNNHGDALERLGRLDEALQRYRRATELNPRLGAAWFGIGDVLHQQGDKQGAANAYRTGLAIQPDEIAAERLAAIEATGTRSVVASRSIVPIFRKSVRGDSLALVIPFKLNEATLLAEATEQLDELATSLRDELTELAIDVEGHCDESGEPGFNEQLSHDRAATVTAALVARGVSSDRLHPVGFGWSNPRYRNDNPTTKALNRRVEFRRR